MSFVDTSMLLFFSAAMAFAASSDLVSMTIPNRLSLALIAGFVVFALAAGLSWSVIGWHLAAGGVMLAATFAMFAAGWVGGGDAKLAAATAVWCGFPTLMEYSLVASMLGGFLTLALLFARGYSLPRFALNWDWAVRLHDKKTGIPYGIALAAAGLIILPETIIWQNTFAA
ncbi:MAG: prepilin peptidase [Proteobacteria bacterium]|nr:prepilin peptidase [Pseudomonadota bacterium]